MKKPLFLLAVFAFQILWGVSAQTSLREKIVFSNTCDDYVFNCTLSAEISGTDVSCNGDNDGSAWIQVAGGVAPFSYLWSTGSTSSIATDLTAGFYSATITDADNCVDSVSISISEPSPIIAIIPTPLPPLCAGGQTTITVDTAYGGDGSFYVFSVDNGPSALIQAAIPVLAGTHLVTIFDEIGCQTSTEITIIDPPVLEMTIESQTDVLCHGDSTGTASLMASGGTAPYFFSWPNGETGSNQNNLYAGYHFVTVTDSKNCTIIEAVEINEPYWILMLVESVSNTTGGFNNGSIQIQISGGVAPYTYQWFRDGILMVDLNSEAINSLAPGSYFVIVSDANGCLFESDPIVIEVSLSANGPDLENQITLIPNPTTGRVAVRTFSSIRFEDIMVYDILGNLVITPLLVFSNHHYQLNLEHSPNGVYLVYIVLGNQLITKKIILQKP